MDIKEFHVKVNNIKCDAQLAIPEQEQVKDNLVIFLAHGNNGKEGMHHPLIEYLFEGLARRGFCTVRFNFPFAQKKKKTRDDNQVLVKTYQAVHKEILKLEPKTVIIGGFSLGSWMSAFMARKKLGDGLLLLGFPMTHNKENIPLKKIYEVNQPMLICNGTEDRYTNPKELMLFVESLKEQGKEVETFFVDNVSHSFKIDDESVITQRDTYQELIEMIDRWIAHHWY